MDWDDIEETQENSEEEAPEEKEVSVEKKTIEKPPEEAPLEEETEGVDAVEDIPDGQESKYGV